MGEGKRISPETRRHMMKTMHDDFWDAPLAARAVILNDILYPPGSTSPEEIAHVTDRVLGRVFDPRLAQRVFDDYDLVPPDILIPANEAAIQTGKHP